MACRLNPAERGTDVTTWATVQLWLCIVSVASAIATARNEPAPVGPGMRAVSFVLNVLLVAWGLAAGVPLW